MAAGGVGCSTGTPSTPRRSPSARTMSIGQPRSSPVTKSLLYCGRYSATRTLPAQTEIGHARIGDLLVYVPVKMVRRIFMTASNQ